MKHVATVTAAAVLGLATWVTTPAVAADTSTKTAPAKSAPVKADAKTADAKAPAGQPPAGEMDAATKAWMEYATPTADHEWLKGLEGTWDTSVTWSAEPNGKPEVSTGKTVNTIIMGGRYLEQEHAGLMMGQPFEGIGLTGYDNSQKKYVATWIDNMGTGIAPSSGTRDAGGKILTSTGQMYDPMSGKMMDYKSVITIVDKNHHTFEMWSPDETGTMFRGLEIKYARAGTAMN